MQVNLLEVVMGAELLLIVGYILYGVVRTYLAKDDRLMVSFYTAVLIGFITSILILNSLLSIPRFLQGDIPILMTVLAINIAIFIGIIGDVLRLKGMQSKYQENHET
ncbi:MAG: hypothetical protein BV458_11505 [Thermoplasmata archaeon M9B2D]|nr:MAG: hypothetical protein BV458_11505 [Thermoplasmata archaeon M9B2D]